MSLVRKDAAGLFVVAGGWTARPGPVVGSSVGLRMDDGGVKEGDHVKATHWAGSSLTRVKLESGQVLYWHHEGKMRDMFLENRPVDPSQYDIKGRRVFR